MFKKFISKKEKEGALKEKIQTTKGTAVFYSVMAAVIIVMLVLMATLFMLYNKERGMRLEVEQDYKQLSTQSGNASREEARQIVEKVKKHIVLDEGVEPTVATIVDIETLQRRNPFYKKARNGDHLIVTPQRAILYDSEKDIILDVIPVQIKPLEQ